MWEFTGLDATGRVVFRRDHTVVDLFPEHETTGARWFATSYGKWRLEGNEIVTDTRDLPIPGYSPHPQRIVRTPIREFKEDTLVRDDGRSDFHRTDTTADQDYTQLLAMFYVAMSVITLLLALYSVKNSSLRNEFILFSVAALFALAWSIATLITELAQTGTVVVSQFSVGAWRTPMEIIRVSCVVVFVIALAKVSYTVKRLKGHCLTSKKKAEGVR
jgi:hypothetical protein